MKVTQHLWFEKDMAAAVSLYTSLIPGSKVVRSSAVMADNPSGPAGSVRMMSFTLGDQNYMAIEAGPLDPFNHAFSIMVELLNMKMRKNRAEKITLHKKLTEETEAAS